MSLLDLIPFEDYKGYEINHNFELLVLHPPGCLGNYYASTISSHKPSIIHKDDYTTDKEFYNYAKIYTYPARFYAENLLRVGDPDDITNEGNDLDFEFDYDKMIKGLDKYVSLNQTFPLVTVLHYPPFMSSIVSNFTFDKLVFIKFQHTTESLQKIRLSGFRNLIKQKRWQDFELYQLEFNKLGLNPDSIEDHKQFLHYMTHHEDISSFLRLYDYENGIWKDVIDVVKERSKKIEYMWFEDILEIDDEHPRIMKKTLNELIEFIGR